MRINWMVLVITADFFWSQNHYFGWNALPQSDAELICDGITALLTALVVLR